MTHSKTQLSAIRLMLFASVGFSLMALCVKAVSGRLPSMEIVFFRSLFGSLMLLGLMSVKRHPLLGKEHRLLIQRGLSGFLALALHFYTIVKLPLGPAVLLNYTSPIFAVIIAALFLGERPGKLLIAMIILSFIGVYCLAGGAYPAGLSKLQAENWGINVLIGLLSAVFAAIAYVSIRAVGRHESPLTVILYFTGISTLGSLLFLPFGFRWPDLREWLLLAGVGVGSFYGQLWMTIALRRAPASLISPFTYLTPLLTFIYGWIFFGEKISALSLFGVILIVTAGSLISCFGTRRT